MAYGNIIYHKTPAKKENVKQNIFTRSNETDRHVANILPTSNR